MAIPVLDLHCDTADRIAWQSLPAELRAATGKEFYNRYDAAEPEGARELKSNICYLSLDRIGETPWAQCFACFVPDELSPEQAVAFESHVYGHLLAQIEKNPGIVLTKSANEARGVLEEGGICAVRTIENARLFAHDLGLIEKFAHEGLLVASLSWNAAGPLASGNDSHEHMSGAGLATLAEMERCGVAMDVSHLNDECFADVAARATRPFCATHSNARAICAHPRNLTDEQFRAIMDAGGVAGLNYCTYFLVDGATGVAGSQITFEQIITHIEHWLDLGGADCVALGSDLDGAPLPDLLAGTDKMPAFQDLLVEHFGQDLAEKLCYKNALAYLERVQAS